MVEATPGEMLSTLSHRGPDGNGVWLEKSAGVGLGQCLRVTTPEALHERQPLVSREGRIALVADARVDNRTDLIQALDLRGDPDKIPDSALILAAYERWGEDCADRIVGDFAFAIWDGNERKWFCARDPFGCRSVHYTHRPGQLFACATEIKALLAVAEIPRELEEMRVGLFLTGTFDDEAITFYKGIFRLATAWSSTRAAFASGGTSSWIPSATCDFAPTKRTPRHFSRSSPKPFAVGCAPRRPSSRH